MKCREVKNLESNKALPARSPMDIPVMRLENDDQGIIDSYQDTPCH